MRLYKDKVIKASCSTFWNYLTQNFNYVYSIYSMTEIIIKIFEKNRNQIS